MMEPTLAVQGVSKRYGGLAVLHHVSFHVARGVVLGLMGPNGAGKTTLLNIMVGECPPDEGRVLFKGEDITRKPVHRICQLGIGRTYQIPQPFGALTVGENLLVPAVFGRRPSNAPAALRIAEILELVGLSDQREALAGDLPVLSLKKLELARALAAEPELLLLDEVAAGMTEREIPAAVQTIRRIRDMGITIVIIEHVTKVLLGVADRIVVLDRGSKIYEGSPDGVMRDEKVVEAYFGT